MRFLNQKKNTIVPLTALVALTMLTACGPRDMETGELIITATPKNAMLNKQINVTPLSPSIRVDFGAGNAQLSEGQTARLDHFFQTQKIRYGSVVEIELPSQVSGNDIAGRRYGALGSYLIEAGYNVQPKVTADSAENALRVYVTKYIATVEEGCQKGWQRPEGTSFENLPLPHMGCSTASTLAAMIANPKDLVEPQSSGGADAERAALAIQKYRTGKSASTGSSGGSESK